MPVLQAAAPRQTDSTDRHVDTRTSRVLQYSQHTTMMFQTHVAVGYLLGAVGRLPMVAAVAGSAMPDLLDRPLCWVGPTSDEHTVGHSLLVAVPGSVVSVLLFGPRGVAFAVGWLVHIAGDILNVATGEGPRVAPSYVLYPLTREGSGDRFLRVSLPVPGIDATHTLNPAMLALELALTCWALVVCARECSTAESPTSA